ncbi:exported hypothetical protein [uncultured Alphaproteobacteria bacterium]|uniref:PRC-barrel domain-containing protein n=1 Tax=uncultured Alphaproteobacteria bacterium TaxID=91750 RepID=A0A212KCL8_9PROT|nr:exported hypothetical protein [uncultured Alphaproteobacteria bacterium]
MTMMKQLLTATALVASVSTVALAQDINRPGTTGNIDNSPAATSQQMNRDSKDMNRNTTAANRDASTATMNAGDTQYGVTVFSKDRPTTPMTTQNGYVTGTQGQVLVSNLIGEEVYNGTGDNAQKVGDVNDVLLSSDGKAQAVVIGVGGFLGIGEKDVAVQFDRVSWGVDGDNDKRLMIQASKADLNSAPSFKR